LTEDLKTTTDNPGRLPKQVKPFQSASLGDYEIHTSAREFSSIRQISYGEVMHSVIAPSEEANNLYVEPSVLASRLLGEQRQKDELVIWDVGLGAATNAMAAIYCFE